MGHGDRAAPLDLNAEGSQHTAAAPQHVPETNGHECTTDPRAQRGRELFGHALGGPQDADGIGRLVRRDVHEAIDTVLDRQLQQVSTAPHVRLHRFARVHLAQR